MSSDPSYPLQAFPHSPSPSAASAAIRQVSPPLSWTLAVPWFIPSASSGFSLKRKCCAVPSARIWIPSHLSNFKANSPLPESLCWLLHSTDSSLLWPPAPLTGMTLLWAKSTRLVTFLYQCITSPNGLSAKPLTNQSPSGSSTAWSTGTQKIFSEKINPLRAYSPKA